MSSITLVSITMALLLGDAPSDQWKRGTEELAKLQGTWQQISGRANGQALPEDVIRGVRVTYAGKKKTVRIDGEIVFDRDVTSEIDPDAMPRTFDQSMIIDDGRRIVVRGIYKLEGDTLTICIAAADEGRPTEFVSRAGTGQTLQVFRRVKAEEGHPKDGAKQP